ncbi:MAG: UDP-N-acetylmuramate--L-alanine ligase [Defluviitaleaceae bacterium]|nr:UDP-N-acetylmuramate--L-alanine ligase [Defluviitaleaceae bacterium]
MKEKNIHFIGIGGISMSGLAEILKRDGCNVSGSDDVETEITKRLQTLGIKVSIPNAAKNITPEIELAVYTAAVKPDNPEFVAAQQMGIPLIERAPFIGKLIQGYDPICVAGSHGKTTTTSMVAEVALAANLDPTIQIGGHMNNGGTNYRVGESKCFILEACEYSNSFHHWQPKIGIILNIDADHLDFFGNMKNLIASFAKFASNIRPDGVLVIREGIPGFEEVVKNTTCKIVTFGLTKNADYYAANIDYHRGKPSFDVFAKSGKVTHIDLHLPGEYNMLNALACFAAVSMLDINPQVIADALSSAKGAKRRFEHKGEFNGIKIVDDYAHHPTEITACLKAARQTQGDGKIVCIFQPHTYTRTKNHLDDFAKAFSDADQTIIIPIYAAREPNDPTISSEILTERVKNNGDNAIYLENFAKASNYVKKNLNKGDMLLTMGAGDVFKIGDKLLCNC